MWRDHPAPKRVRRRRRKLWIGLVCVKQIKRNGVLGDAYGAYVNAIALAIDDSDFGSQVEKALGELDLELVSLEDIETLIARLSKHSIDEDLHRAAAEVKHTGSLAFGTFHTFPDDAKDSLEEH
jgi:hypothetical protein